MDKISLRKNFGKKLFKKKIKISLRKKNLQKKENIENFPMKWIFSKVFYKHKIVENFLFLEKIFFNKKKLEKISLRKYLKKKCLLRKNFRTFSFKNKFWKFEK